MDKNASILVIGAGTFGLSTAWHLVRDGYTNITVIDRHEAPSVASAGHDLNKIFRLEYAVDLYTQMAVEARKAWLEEPVLKGLYHENGYIFAVSGKSAPSVANYEAAVANSAARGSAFEKLESPEAFRAKAPFLDGEMKGWKGVWQPQGGWMHARDSLQALTNDCKKRGVKFVSGPSGAVKSFRASPDKRTIVVAEDGTEYSPDKVVLAAGAWIDSVLPTEGQLLAKCWCYIHITLSEEEAKKFAKMPVINNRELGYMFEPDAEGRRLKVCPHTTGYTHYVDPQRTRSVPRSKAVHPTDWIPVEAEKQIREFLAECLPSLATRPFSNAAMCWDAESPSDGDFLICRHPGFSNLFIAGGASAHGFKFLPTIGSKVKDLLEDKLDPELADLWRWRPGSERKVDTSRPSVPVLDIQDMSGWKRDAKL
ncbi:hypothetical protein JCM10207_002017 [Rhodosporidiobolus poonsookiae]